MPMSAPGFVVDDVATDRKATVGAPELPGVILPGRKSRSPLGDAARTLRRKPIALIGLAILLGWLSLGILAPVLPLLDPNYQDLSQ